MKKLVIELTVEDEAIDQWILDSCVESNLEIHTGKIVQPLTDEQIDTGIANEIGHSRLQQHMVRGAKWLRLQHFGR